MFSTTAEYALRIMIVLAGSHAEPMTSERIAASAKVPTDYSVKVLQMLARARLVRAQRGRGGGFQIACDPARTSFLDVINAIDPVYRVKALMPPEEPEPPAFRLLHRRLDESVELLQRRLTELTIQGVLDESEEETFAPPSPRTSSSHLAP